MKAFPCPTSSEEKSSQVVCLFLELAFTNILILYIRHDHLKFFNVFVIFVFNIALMFYGAMHLALSVKCECFIKEY